MTNVDACCLQRCKEAWHCTIKRLVVRVDGLGNRWPRPLGAAEVMTSRPPRILMFTLTPLLAPTGAAGRRATVDGMPTPLVDPPPDVLACGP
jgi:hypothetical protein